MTFLVGQEKLKINITQSIQLMDEEKLICMRIEISFPHFEEQAPKILQQETLKGIKLNANLVSTKELELDLKLLNLDVEELIFMKDEDGEGALATKYEGPKKRSNTFPMSLAGL